MSGGIPTLADTFERLAADLPLDPDFRGVEIVSFRARRLGRSTELQVVVDREGGVDLELCGRIAAKVNAGLEAETDPYTLAVESAGIERPLVRLEDFDRFRDKRVRITTKLAIASEYTHRGRLLGVRENLVLLERKGGELPIPHELIKAANLEYDYRDDLRRDKRERREQR